MASFTHLHVHTQYSFLDGAILMDSLGQTIKDRGMDACAITDHGNLFGAIDFYKRAKEQKIKPILGAELWVTSDMKDRTSRKNHHLIVLAKDAAGWKNLMYLVSMGYTQGFYYKPRVDKALLRAHSEGLIGLSGCLGGEIPAACVTRDLDTARAAAREYKQIFSPGQFFLELQDNGKEDQAVANGQLRQLSEDEDLPLVATNNCHYRDKEDAAAHEVLLCIQYGKPLGSEKMIRKPSNALYLRTPAEMEAAFSDCPEAIANTQRIKEMITLELSLGKPMLPTFRPADGSDLETHLRQRARDGLDRRFTELAYPFDRDSYRQRLEFELAVIIEMKFPGYFLIVADFINWAKENRIAVGPGRGSGAGSLVAYALRITDLDPIPYALLFERFLNPERISMPDFDVDFCQERRGEVIEYVSEKYGRNNVGQIATFAQMKAKSVIKDVARALEVPFQDVNALTKLLPNVYKDDKGNTKPITIEKALELEPKLRLLAEENETYGRIIEIARRLEGLYRQAGMHAAGIVIADAPLWEVVPVFVGKEGELVSEFSMNDVEAAGLVKFDFLGLKTLDVIDHAERHVNRRVADEIQRKDADALFVHPHVRRLLGPHARIKEALAKGELDCRECSLDAPIEGKLDLTLRTMLQPYEDSKVYQLISSGDTVGVFQLESTGFRELLKRLKPDCFEDIVAAVALYRPGPLQTGMVDDFINTKHGRKSIVYPHPLLETVLKPTYGVFVYQEQVMQAAQVMAGFSLGGADLLRRAMGKKKAEVMAAERGKFVAGCTSNGIPAREAGDVFDLMEKFAGYGFNKSHSAAYALVTFETAYLKTYYPVEFMAALLTTESGSTENVVKYTAEARKMGIQVLPPTVNESEISFSVDRQRIRFGLGAIKGLGESALQGLLDARIKGPFKSIYDFVERVPLKHVNRKTLESLVRSGAFDGFGRPRAQLMSALDRAMDAAKSTQHDQAVGQASLFGGAVSVKPRETYDDVPEWPELERLELEKEALGFYVTGHPLDRYASEISRLTNADLASLDARHAGSDVVIGVTVTGVRERPLKDGSGRMAFISIVDRTGATELLVGAREFQELEPTLKSGLPLLLKVGVRVLRGDEVETLRLRLLEARTIEAARASGTKAIEVTLDDSAVEVEKLHKLKALLAEHPGECTFGFRIRIPGVADVDLKLPDVRASASDALVDRVEAIFGRSVVRFA
ncbi:MAG: DNA polymerase III subunit alpha [Deltaproteobacteria bacterium]|nr:DNA polymerase III subunit alpha [Deltaproteobacteria bacterium]